jgi:hypothetical protein
MSDNSATKLEAERVYSLPKGKLIGFAVKIVYMVCVSQWGTLGRGTPGSRGNEAVESSGEEPGEGYPAPLAEMLRV